MERRIPSLFQKVDSERVENTALQDSFSVRPPEPGSFLVQFFWLILFKVQLLQPLKFQYIQQKLFYMKGMRLFAKNPWR